MIRLSYVPLVVFLLAVAIPNGAPAAPSQQTSDAEKQARKTFQSAEIHFKAGNFSEALEDYKAGYDLYPLPGFLINIAQCHRRLGDLEKARTTYRKFIMVAPDSSYVPEVNALIAELDKLISEFESNQSATPLASTAPPPVSTAVPVVEEKPAPNPGLAVQQTQESTQPEPSSANETRWWLWGTVGAAALVGVATTVFLLRSPDTVVIHEGSLGTLSQ